MIRMRMKNRKRKTISREEMMERKRRLSIQIQYLSNLDSSTISSMGLDQNSEEPALAF